MAWRKANGFQAVYTISPQARLHLGCLCFQQTDDDLDLGLHEGILGLTAAACVFNTNNKTYNCFHYNKSRIRFWSGVIGGP